MYLCPERAVCSHFWNLVDIFSSNVNEVIEQFQIFSFFYEKILHAQKAQKVQKCNQAKAQKAHKKHKKANKRISDFSPLRCFLCAYKRCLFCFCSLICVLCFLRLQNLFVKKKLKSLKLP